MLFLSQIVTLIRSASVSLPPTKGCTTAKHRFLVSMVAVVLCLTLNNRSNAQLTFSLTWGWQGDARQNAASQALTNSLARFNAYGDFTAGNDGSVEAAYNPGVPTAQANYGGWGGIIEYGGTWPNDRVTIHELNHWLGTGTYSNANGLSWSGPRTVSLLEQFEGVGARLGTDGVHFWPYGLNFDSEWSELNARRNVALTYALRADWGIGSTANPTAWNANSVTLTRSDNPGESGFNRRTMWSDDTFAHPNADYSTGTYDLRTPTGYPSWTFAGKSLTVNQGGRLLYNSWGHSGLVTINDLTIDGSTVRHDQNDGNPNQKLDTFRLAGNATLLGNATFDAAEGDFVVEASLSGSGTLVKSGTYDLTLNRANTYTGATTVSSGRLIVNGTTGYGQTTLASGTTLSGAGQVRDALAALSGSTVQVGEAGLPLQLPSGHVLLDDFESYGTGATTNATGGAWSAEFDETANSNIVIADAGHGRALQTMGGAAWRGAERNLAGSDAAVRVDETKTYFWQVKPSYSGPRTSNWVYDFMMGLSPGVSSIDSVDAWQDFAVMPFINNAPNTPYINAEGPVEPWWGPINRDQWHNVWVVIDNDQNDPSFDLYFSTEADPDNPILVVANANWRNFAPGVDLNAIGFMAAGAAGSEFLVDNIYYITGESTDNPLGQTAELVGETLTIGGDFTLQTTATLEVDVAELAHDSVDVSGSAVLDGILSVTRAASYQPTLGDAFSLLTAADITNNLTLAGPDAALFSLAASTATELVLTAVSGLEGDYNNDGLVDAADYTVWRDQLGAPAGTLFNDFQGAAVGVAQYNAWKQNYGAAIPASSSTQTIPEPTALLLAVVGLAISLLVARGARE